MYIEISGSNDKPRAQDKCLSRKLVFAFWMEFIWSPVDLNDAVENITIWHMQNDTRN